TGFFIIPTLFSTAESSQGSATKPLSAATRQMLAVRFAHRDQQEGSFHLASLAPLFLCSDPYRSLCCLRIARACRGAEGTSRGQKKSAWPFCCGGWAQIVRFGLCNLPRPGRARRRARTQYRHTPGSAAAVRRGNSAHSPGRNPSDGNARV